VKQRSRIVRGLAVLAVTSLTVAACGGDDDDDSAEPAAETTAAAEPTAEEPAAEEPAAEEPAADTTMAEEPSAEEPAADTTMAEEPSAEEPASMEPPAEAPGFDGEKFTVGIITDQSGPAAVIGGPLTNGLEVYFQGYNERTGGVAGMYPIETEVVDSQYNASQAVQQYGAIKDDVAVVSSLGTAVTLAVLEGLKEDNKVGAPQSLDSFWAREPNLLPIGAPYQLQGINGINYAYTEGGASADTDVLCVFMQDDAYGEAGLEGVQFAADNLGLEVASVARYTSGDTDFTTQITQLQGDGCTVVWLNALPSVTGGALGKAAEVGFAPHWYAQSPTWIGALAASPLAPYLQANFTWVSEGTQWGDDSVPGMAQMIADVAEYSPDQEPDVYFVFGYNQANAIASLFEEAVANGDVSGEGLIAAMETMTTDFGGLLGDWTYGPADTRTPPIISSIYAVNPDLFEETGGLEVVARDVEAPFAGDFEFVAREG
jgi:ABC-type branched-subunit amino acid transport system substrate-binding protein